MNIKKWVFNKNFKISYLQNRVVYNYQQLFIIFKKTLKIKTLKIISFVDKSV